MFFLHGFMGSVEDFDFFPKDFTGLQYASALGTVSETPWDEVSNYLWEQVNGKKTSLFGYSMGGRIALAMFAAQPDRVEKLILCGAQFRPPVEQTKSPLPLGEEGQKSAAGLRKIVDEERAIFLREKPEAFLKWWATLELFGPQNSPTWSLVKERRRTRMKTMAPSWANLLQRLSVSEQQDFSELIKEHAQKIIFIYGENDKKYETFAAQYRKLGVRTVAVPDAWHAVHLDNPSGLLSVLHRF